MAELSLVFDLLARDRASSEVRKVGDSMDDAGRRASGFGSMVGSAMKGAAVAAGALLAGGAYALSGFVTDAAESAKISRLTEAAIASTGGAAKISADQIGDLATALSNKTAIDDEAIQSASNLLLTFTNVRNEAGEGNNIFDQATEAALNMSTAMGTDANAAAMQLGKALNDPIKGVAALGKAGVQFTAEQKEQIRTMVESGDVMGAQSMILGELNTQFGGAAAAAADPMARLGVIAGNLGEQVGGALLPYVEQFSTWLVDRGLPYVERLIGQFETQLPPAIAFLSSAFTTISGVLQNDVWPALQAIGGWVQDNQTTVTVIAGLIGGVLAAAFVRWGIQATIAATMNAWAWLSGLASSVAGAVGMAVNAAIVVGSWVLMGAQALAQGVRIAAVWTTQIIASAVRGAISMAVQAALVVGSWVLMGAQAVAQAAVIAAQWAMAAARTVASLVVMAVQFAIQGAVMVASAAVTAAGVVAGWVLMGAQAMAQAVRMAAAWFIALGPIGWVIAAVIGIVALVIANWDRVKAFTVAAWRALSDAVVSGVERVVSFVQGLPGKIMSGLGSLSNLLTSAGGDLLRGLQNGISNAVQGVVDAAKRAAKAAVDGVKNFLGIASPSKVMRGIGVNMGEGLALGIADMRPGVAAELAALADAQALPLLADLGVTSSGGGGLGYRPPGYDMPTGGAAAGGGGVTHTTLVTGVVGPEEVADLVARGQSTTEFLAGAGT